jgi:hypothetical protein
MRKLLCLALAAALALAAGAAWAQPTHIVVHVKSKDAKFVGSSMGGVAITIRDHATGELLAQGVTAGGTGDTARLMKEPHERGKPLSTPDAAQWKTTLDLKQPTKLEISAHGPLAQAQSANTVSLTTWVVPGKHLDQGDGVLMELPGFIVDVMEPPAHLVKTGAPQEIWLTANVTMMCGCPIKPDFIWDANRYEVKALITKGGQKVGEQALAYAGETSQFSADLELTEPGAYLITVYAYDPQTGNTGLDRTTVVVKKKE